MSKVIIDQICKAVDKFHVDTIVVSFSGVYLFNHTRDDLQKMRDLIPYEVNNKDWRGCSPAS